MVREIRLIARAAKRVGAFKRARANGLSGELARAYSDAVYPPAPADLAFEEGMRSGMGNWAAAHRAAKLSGPTTFPWPSLVSLLYPIGGAIDTALRMPDPSAMVIVGSGLSNLGYLLLAAGFLAGSFRIFGLKKRWQVFSFAAISYAAGTWLINVVL